MRELYFVFCFGSQSDEGACVEWGFKTGTPRLSAQLSYAEDERG